MKSLKLLQKGEKQNKLILMILLDIAVICPI